MIVRSAFEPAWWLSNPHAQTVMASLMRWDDPPATRKERLELPDGDFVDLAWADEGVHADAPLVILLHGLGGGVHSPYIVAQMRAYQKMGWRSVLMHFRGASGEPNRLLRAYHSGDTADLTYFLQTLVEREPNTQKCVLGFSLGGNVVLKWLGEQPQQEWIKAAAAVSVPFQLNVAADRLNSGMSRVYQFYLLRQLRHMLQSKIQKHADKPLLDALHASKCFWTFDDTITAPLHGFENVHDYYRRASSHAYLSYIRTTTLIIHAEDDPFMTPTAIPDIDAISSSVTLELSSKGGHVGFVSGSTPGRPKYWLDERIPQFFASTIF